MLEYPVYDGEAVIGTAKAEKQGMFYLLKIRCTPLSGKPDEIVLSNGQRKINLGLCVPDGGEMSLVKRVKKNEIDDEDVKITVLSAQKTELMPDPLENLQRAYIGESGELVVAIEDQSSSNPTGQWSEPMISE